MKLGPLVTVLALACSDGSAAVLTDGDVPSNETLTGAWDVTLTLDHPYPLGFSSPAARRVCGTIGFVEGEGEKTNGPGRAANGVYRIPLFRIGLDWLDDAGFPRAVAKQAQIADGPHHGADSVSIVLNPDSKERIELDGIYEMAGISGNWIAQSARGTASGEFTMRQHSSARDTSC